MGHDVWLDSLRRAAGDPDAVDRLVDRLRQRQWNGDEELTDTLEDVMGRHPSPLRPLPVELAEVGEAPSEQAGTENYLDPRDGHGLVPHHERLRCRR